MILFNHIKLAKALRKGEVTETGRFLYFFVIFLLVNVMTMLSLTGWANEGRSVNQLDVVIDVVNISILLIGTLIAFRVNATGDHRDFIARFICLSVPIGIQTIIVAFIAMAAAMALDPNLATASEATITTALLNVGMGLYFYAQMLWAVGTAAHLKIDPRDQI